jgi:hypothetical protein
MNLSQFGRFYLVAKKRDDFLKGIRSDDVSSYESEDIKKYISNSIGVEVKLMRVAGEMLGPDCYYHRDYFPPWYDIYVIPIYDDRVRFHIGIGRKDTVIDRFIDDSDTFQCPANLPTTDDVPLST